MSDSWRSWAAQKAAAASRGVAPASAISVSRSPLTSHGTRTLITSGSDEPATSGAATSIRAAVITRRLIAVGSATRAPSVRPSAKSYG